MPYHYDQQGRFVKTPRKDRVTPPRGPAMTTKTLDGQQLLVKPETRCADCGKTPKKPLLVNWRERLLCQRCYRECVKAAQNTKDNT